MLSLGLIQITTGVAGLFLLGHRRGKGFDARLLKLLGRPGTDPGQIDGRIELLSPALIRASGYISPSKITYNPVV